MLWILYDSLFYSNFCQLRISSLFCWLIKQASWKSVRFSFFLLIFFRCYSCFFFLYSVGTNSHFSHSIEERFLDTNKLWFSDYLDATTDDDHAEVYAFFRVIRRSETFCQNYVASNIRSQLHGEATHMIDKDLFGYEIIYSMQRPVNLRRES